MPGSEANGEAAVPDLGFHGLMFTRTNLQPPPAAQLGEPKGAFARTFRFELGYELEADSD